MNIMLVFSITDLINSIKLFLNTSRDWAVTYYENNKDAIILAAITLVISAVIIPIIVYMIKKKKESSEVKKAEFTGVWTESIYDKDGVPIKKDLFYLKQDGETITGKARRFFRPEEKGKCYEALGRVFKEKDMLAIFWATAPVLPNSYGCGIVHQVESNFFSGYYYNIKPIALQIENTFLSRQNSSNQSKKLDEVPCVTVEMRKLSSWKHKDFKRFYKTGKTKLNLEA